MTLKKMVATLKVHKWHTWNVCVRLVEVLHEPYQALLSASMSLNLLESIAEVDHHSIDDDLIVYGCCLLIPTSLRATTLSCLHDEELLAPRQEPASPSTGPALTGTLKPLSRAAATVRITYPPMPRSQWWASRYRIGHSNRLQPTLHHMAASSSSS